MSTHTPELRCCETTDLWFPVANEADSPVANRFQKYVVKHDEDGACWTYTGATDEWGYGCFRWLKTVPAHRAAFQLARGRKPDGCVLHSCDNARCVNPSHLSEGTHADNQRQKCERNRQAKGEQNGRAKLTWDQVREIRRRVANGTRKSQLASEYGVDGKLIRQIVAGRIWKEEAA